MGLSVLCGSGEEQFQQMDSLFAPHIDSIRAEPAARNLNSGTPLLRGPEPGRKALPL
jgi:hypothetical protein